MAIGGKLVRGTVAVFFSGVHYGASGATFANELAGTSASQVGLDG
jgi:hypothetical protein